MKTNPLSQLVSFMTKHGYNMTKSEANSYETKTGKKQGILATFSNGRVYQIGQARFWRVA